MWVSASAVISVRSSVLLPLRGATDDRDVALAALQVGDERVAPLLERAVDQPDRDPQIAVRERRTRAAGRSPSGRSSWSSVAGSSSGGSHTGCAGGPASRSRSTITCRTVSALGVSLGFRARPGRLGRAAYGTT